MKSALFIISFLAISLFSFATKTTDAKDKPKGSSFAHHSGEFHITPSADYILYQKGSDYKALLPTSSACLLLVSI